MKVLHSYLTFAKRAFKKKKYGSIFIFKENEKKSQILPTNQYYGEVFFKFKFLMRSNSYVQISHTTMCRGVFTTTM